MFLENYVKQLKLKTRNALTCIAMDREMSIRTYSFCRPFPTPLTCL